MGFLDFWRESTEAHLKQCKEHPRKCFRQLMVDGLVIVASYGLLTYLLDGKALNPRRTLAFYALFLALAYAFRYLDVDFQEQLTRVAGFQIGTKLFGALAG